VAPALIPRSTRTWLAVSSPRSERSKDLCLGNEQGHHQNAANEQQAHARLRLWHGADRCGFAAGRVAKWRSPLLRCGAKAQIGPARKEWKRKPKGRRRRTSVATHGRFLLFLGATSVIVVLSSWREVSSSRCGPIEYLLGSETENWIRAYTRASKSAGKSLRAYDGFGVTALIRLTSPSERRPKLVLPPGTVCLRVPSPCGA